MIRFRLLNQVIKELKKIDPDTAVTKNAVKKLGVSGKIPVLKYSNRTLYDLDGLLMYLSHPYQSTRHFSR